MAQLSLLEQARIEIPELTDGERIGHLARRLIEELGYQVATAKEARETLGLKGPDRTTF